MAVAAAVRERDDEAVGAGERDRLVVIEIGREAGRDASGKLVREWSPWARWWVKQEAVSGTEAFAALQLAAKVNTRFRGEYREGLTPKPELRIVDPEGRVYDIVSVREIGRQAGHEVLAWARAE